MVALREKLGEVVGTTLASLLATFTSVALVIFIVVVSETGATNENATTKREIYVSGFCTMGSTGLEEWDVTEVFETDLKESLGTLKSRIVGRCQRKERIHITGTAGSYAVRIKREGHELTDVDEETLEQLGIRFGETLVALVSCKLLAA